MFFINKFGTMDRSNLCFSVKLLFILRQKLGLQCQASKYSYLIIRLFFLQCYMFDYQIKYSQVSFLAPGPTAM